jgi:hypothetical protein
MRFIPDKKDSFKGAFIYAAGDTIAALILGDFSIIRLLGMMLIGATIYAWEIPSYFRWIDRRTKGIEHKIKHAFTRTLLAFLYFNPLWIARHLIFIAILSSNPENITYTLLKTAIISWFFNIPISIIGNAIIQLGLPLKWRFAGSAIFSGLMAIYYAMSGVWFNAEK